MSPIFPPTTTAARPRPSRRRVFALAACAGAVTLAACGSSGGSGTTAASGHSSRGVAFARCMRSHGVPNLPDPTGGGIHIPAGSGIDPFSPVFKAAQAACAKLLPGGGPAGRHPTAQLIAQTRQMSECMRRHGVTGFPDPTVKPPSRPSDYSILENRDGVIIAVPNTIDPRSPIFRQAARTCHFS